MYTVDASVWVNSFDQQETGSQKGRAFLEILARQAVAIYVPTLVLVEVAAAISRSRQNALQAEAFATALSQLPNLYLVSRQS